MASSNNSYYYPQGGANFADYWKYSQYSRMISILNGTGNNGYSGGVNILDGRAVNGQNYLDFDYSITRGESAKLLTQTNQAWWSLSTVRNGYDFADSMNHWARYSINQAYALGFVNGTGANTFSPDSSLTNQEMMAVFANVIDKSYKYDIYDFINMVNAGDVARITSSWNNNNNNNGNNTPRVDAWYFTQTPIYLNMGSTFNLRGVMSGWNDTIRFSSDDTSVATVVNSSGVITPVGVGRCMITGSDSYGITNSVEVVVQSSGSTLPVVTNSPSQMIFTQATISIQRGNSVNLMDYIKYAPGNVTFTGGNQFVTVSGSTATGIAVGKCTVTATSSGQTATVIIDVVDNNVSPIGINPEVEWADNNSTQNLNFVIRGIDSTCEVHVNDNSNYSLREDYRAATWGKYSVLGLYPEGGTDAIEVSVWQNGQKVWAAPVKVWYTGD